MLSFVYSFALLVVAFAIDKDITYVLKDYAHSGFVDFFNRSTFQGFSVGMSDIPVALFLIYLVYTAFQKLWHKFYFVLAASLSIAASVHLLKGIIGRKRPGSGGSFDFHIFDGWGVGSFPSGHTAMMASLLIFTHCIPQYSRIIFFSVCLLCVTMSFSRIAIEAHWFSDTLASFLIATWIIKKWQRKYL